MRYISFAGLFIVISWGLITFFTGQQAPAEAHSYRALYKVMDRTGAQVVQGEIHYWAELAPCTGMCSEEKMQEKADELFGLIAGRLVSIPVKKRENAEHSSQKNPGGEASDCQVVRREKTIAPGLQLQMVLQRMEQENDNPLHLLVVIRETGDARQINEMAGKLLALMDSRTVKSSLSFSLTGHVNEKMRLDQMETLAYQAARDSGGQQIQGVKDEHMVSVTGYLPELGEYIQAENMRINLNLALRYDANGDKTVVRAGTPLIAGWY